MYRSARAVDQRRDRGPLACVVASDVEKGLMAGEPFKSPPCGEKLRLESPR